MSVQSDAAKKHIEKLLNEAYPEKTDIIFGTPTGDWYREYAFNHEHRIKNPKTGRMIHDWRFDYAVPAIRCANGEGVFIPPLNYHTPFIFPFSGVIELDGGIYTNPKAHLNVDVLMKGNQAVSLGWRVWHYAPSMVILAGRKSKQIGRDHRHRFGRVSLELAA